MNPEDVSLSQRANRSSSEDCLSRIGVMHWRFVAPSQRIAATPCGSHRTVRTFFLHFPEDAHCVSESELPIGRLDIDMKPARPRETLASRLRADIRRIAFRLVQRDF